jgi:type IV secretion system protein VirB9
VFDDGNKTFFQFSKAKVPAIFIVNSDYTETLVNFRKEGEYLVVDGEHTQFTLRDGNEWVCLFNLRKPDFAAPDPFIEAPALTKVDKRRGSGNKKNG